MGLKISDATKEELIQYFFTEDTFGGGYRIRADKERFLLWLAKKRAGKLMEAQNAAMDTEQESLRKYIDAVKAFNEEKDIGKYEGDFQYITINEGICYVAFPEDAHMPGRHLDVPNDFVKVVVKLKV